MVKKWFTDSSCGRQSTSDAERSGGLIEIETLEIIEQIHHIFLVYRRLKLFEIMEARGFHMVQWFRFWHEKAFLYMVAGFATIDDSVCQL